MDTKIIIALITISVGIITVVLNFIFDRLNGKNDKTIAEIKLLKAEEEGKVLDNLLQNMEIFDRLLKPLQLQIEELKLEINNMKPLICKNATTCKDRVI